VTSILDPESILIAVDEKHKTFYYLHAKAESRMIEWSIIVCVSYRLS